MPNSPPTHRPKTAPTRHEQNRDYDQRRGNARDRGYTSRWDKARLTWLNRHPLCVMCEREGRVTAAKVVDHIIPHRGPDGLSDPVLFWDTANWQSLCKPHHDRDKQRLEKNR